MKIGTQRAMDRLIGTFLCGVLSLFPWRYRQVPFGFQPHNVLVIILSEMGSLALAGPLFARIREKYPEASLHLAESIEGEGCPLVKEPPGSNPAPTSLLKVAPEEIKAFSLGFQRDFPHLQGRSLVLIYPGGGLLPIRAWPRTSYEAVARALLKRGYSVGVVGLEQDKQLAGRILSACRSAFCVDLTGYTRSVKDLVLLFHRAALLISNDGGPGHLASLTPIPTIVLYGPETPSLYGITGPKTHVFYNPIPCSPCLTAFNHRRSPCDGNNVCLRGISPQRALEKASEFLRQ
jgi:ADP-heptose:LPS heptosyltransferase